MQPTFSITAFASHLRGQIQTRTTWAALNNDDTFNELALGLFELQLRSNEAYHRFVDGSAPTGRPIRHWTQIPAVPAAGFKEFEFSCLPPFERTRVFHSSQTTGQDPSRHFHNTASLALYEDALYAWFEANVLRGLSVGHVGSVLALTPDWTDAPHSSLVHMFKAVGERIGTHVTSFGAGVSADGSWKLDIPRVLEMLAGVEKAGQPALVLGTAFSFVHLVDHPEVKRLKCQLPPGSRVMETGGYKGRSRTIPKSELHSLICQRLGVPPQYLVSEYGMSELSSQAYDVAMGEPHGEGRGESGVFRFPPWTRVQLISPETGAVQPEGQAGLIRVLDLANAYSLMAIQTADLGVGRRDGFELIGRAAGSEVRGCSLMPAA